MLPEFDEASHVYRVDGRVVPHVTGVLRSVLGDPFARVPPAVLERKRQIGSAVHLACHLDDAGELDESTVHHDVVPFLEAWRKFRREFRFDEVVLSERPLYSPRLDLATTPDRVVRLGDLRAVVELKSGLPGALAGLQTAAQAAVYDDFFGVEINRRFAMQAMPSGRYKLTEYTSPSDLRDFLSCLNVSRLKERLAA